MVYFHYWLLLDFRTVFVEMKLPILLFYWTTYFFMRSDEKFPFFHPMKAIVRTDEANSMAFLQREFLPSNDTYTTKTSTANTSFLAFVYLYKTLKPPCSKANKKATMMYSWPYLGKAGLTKIALKRFSVVMHFQHIINALKSISNAFWNIANAFQRKRHALQIHLKSIFKTLSMYWQTLTTHLMK